MDTQLLLFCLVAGNALLRVQGYYNSNNNQFHQQQPHNNHTNMDDLINFNYRFDPTDDVFRHYRSDIKREPRFISFETRDDNIEVELDFAIPFLSIPVKRSLSSGVANTMQNMLSGVPFANVNLGAVILAGFVAIGGAVLGGLTRAFKGGNGSGFGYTDLFLQKSDKSKQQRYYQDIAMDILENVDKALMKYNFDTTACTQRVVCWYIKESIANVVERRASRMDKIVDGMITSDWAFQMIAGTAIEDAIKAGKRGQNCEQTFSNCQLNSDKMDKFIQNLIKNSEKPAEDN